MAMWIEFTAHAWDFFCYRLDHDTDMVLIIKELLQAIRKKPFKEIGQQEPLKFGLRGCWSRTITSEHRLVYVISGNKGADQRCTVLQCRFHYDDK
jgi:toxin YoeB